jgi:hypothetical protein
MSPPEAAKQVSEGSEARFRFVKKGILTRNVGIYSTPMYGIEACFKALRGKLTTHTSTISKDGPRGGGLWPELCLNLKGKIR